MHKGSKSLKLHYILKIILPNWRALRNGSKNCCKLKERNFRGNGERRSPSISERFFLKTAVMSRENAPRISFVVSYFMKVEENPALLMTR